MRAWHCVLRARVSAHHENLSTSQKGALANHYNVGRWCIGKFGILPAPFRSVAFLSFRLPSAYLEADLSVHTSSPLQSGVPNLHNLSL